MPLSIFGTHAKNRRLAVIACTTCAVTVLATASASAYFTVTGSGNGTANVGSGVVVTTNAIAAQGAVLFPGGAAVPITLQFNRPGTTDVRLNTFAPRAGNITADAAHAGCVGTNGINANEFITVASVANLAPPIDVTSPTVTRTIPAIVRMTTDAPNACQGATFTIPVLLTGVVL